MSVNEVVTLPEVSTIFVDLVAKVTAAEDRAFDLDFEKIVSKQELKEAKEAKAEIVGVRTAIETRRTVAKKGPLEWCRELDNTAKQLTAKVAIPEAKVDRLLKDYNDEIERIREEEARELKARIDAEKAEQAAKAAERIDMFRQIGVMVDPSVALNMSDGEFRVAFDTHSKIWEAKQAEARAEAERRAEAEAKAKAEFEAERAKLKAEREALEAENAKARAELERMRQEQEAEAARLAKEAAEAKAKAEKAMLEEIRVSYQKTLEFLRDHAIYTQNKMSIIDIQKIQRAPGLAVVVNEYLEATKALRYQCEAMLDGRPYYLAGRNTSAG